MQKVIPNNAVLIPAQAESVFKGAIFDTYQWPQTLFDGTQATFEMLRRPDSVSVIGIVEEKIMLLYDEQPHVGTRRNFPGGRVEQTDKDVLSAAKRETLEETGYEFENWKLLRVSQPEPKIEWLIHTFVAWNGTQTAKPEPDGGERLTLELLAFDEIKNMATRAEGDPNFIHDMLEACKTLDELVDHPEFKGQKIIR